MDIITVFPVIAVCLDFVLMMEKIIRLTRFMSGVGVSFADILRVVILIQPQLLILTLPMSFLIAVLITYGRMNMDSEIVVMKSAGISMWQISYPAFVSGLVVFLLTLMMTVYVSPLSARKLRLLVNETVRMRAPLALDAGVFHNEFKGITLMIGSKPSPHEMRDIFVYDERDKDRPKVITSKSGRIVFNRAGDPVFDIRNGSLDIINGNTFTELTFRRYVFRITLGLNMLTERLKEKTPLQLLQYAEKLRGKRRREVMVEFHRRFTLPFINIFLIFLGPPLSMLSGKRGRLSGFVFGIAVCGVYYAMLVYFENLVRTGKLYHMFAWAPVMIIGLFSVLLYWRESKR